MWLNSSTTTLNNTFCFHCFVNLEKSILPIEYTSKLSVDCPSRTHFFYQFVDIFHCRDWLSPCRLFCLGDPRTSMLDWNQWSWRLSVSSSVKACNSTRTLGYPPECQLRQVTRQHLSLNTHNNTTNCSVKLTSVCRVTSWWWYHARYIFWLKTVGLGEYCL